MRFRLSVIGTAMLVLCSPAAAPARMLGGGDTRSDCNVTFEGIDSANDRVVECVDGSTCDADHVADKRCTFGISVCLCQSDVAGCTPSTVRRFRNVHGARALVAAARGLLPASSAECSAPTDVVVRLRKNGTQPGARTIRTVAFMDGHPGRDSDHFRLVCMPATPAP